MKTELDKNEKLSTEHETPPIANVLLGEVVSPFTEKEQRIMQLIVEAHNEFVKLERGHSMEIQEWVSGVHQLQSILSHRCLRRLFPSHFA